MPHMSEQINELAAALAKVQGQLPEVKKTKTVKVSTKTGGSYSYTYAPLDAVWNCCRRLLTDNGLAVSQTMQEADGHPHLETILLHTSGQWLSSSLPLIATADPQQLGSCIIYMRRYALASLVGIVADEDDDGQAGRPQQGKQQEQKPSRQQSHQRPANGTQKKPPSGSDDRKVLIAQIVQMEKAHFQAWKHKENARLKHLGYGELSEALNEDLKCYRDYLEGKPAAEVQAELIAAN